MGTNARRSPDQEAPRRSENRGRKVIRKHRHKDDVADVGRVREGKQEERQRSGSMDAMPIRGQGRSVRADNYVPGESQSRLRAVRIGDGLPVLSKLSEEIFDMTDVLLGRKLPPVDKGTMTLMETADAYFARASEIAILIYTKQREQDLKSNHPLVKFRTSELRTFLEIAKRAADLGSRRLTDEQLRFEMERLGRESGY